jgi:hypothetical protein
VTRSRDLLTLEEAKCLAAITPRQAAHLCGNMGKNSMYRAINTGAIQSVRIGSKILIPVEPLLRRLAGDDR